MEMLGVSTKQFHIAQQDHINLAPETYMSSKKNIIQYSNKYGSKNFWKMDLVQDIISLVKK